MADVNVSPVIPNEAGLVTVILPVYNGERYLAAAIDSILAQTAPPHEVIVVDDGSTDGTRVVVQGFGAAVRYVYQPNRGSGAALNRGIELAATEYLAFLDADDLWLPDKLAKQLARFEQHPELEAVFGHVQQFYSPELAQAATDRVRYGQEIVAGYHTDTLLIRKAAWARIGRLDERLKACFIDWFTRAREMQLRDHLLVDVVAMRRVHDTNLTIRARADIQAEYFQLLRANLARKRGERAAIE